MTSVLLTIHLIVSVALVITVLLQRSEGGALGIGGGGPGGLMSGRAAASMLTRTTSVLGAAFFVVSILLTVVPNWGKQTIDSEIIGQSIEETPASVVEELPLLTETPEYQAPVNSSVDNVVPTEKQAEETVENGKSD